MPSILDTLFGTSVAQTPGAPLQQGGSIFDFLKPPTSTDPLDPAVMRRHQWTDGLAGLSQGLLAAGGPSLMPMDFGSALGKGLSGALTARDSGEDRYLKRALVSSQVQTARDEAARQKAITKTILDAAGPDPAATPVSSVTPPVGAPTPLMPGAGGGGPSNSTNPGNLADGKGGFQTFKSPEEGVAAAIKLAQEFPKRYNGGQPMTLAQVEAHWAPPDDGKDPMTRGNKQGVWSGNVARGMGIGPNTPLDFSNPQVGLAFAQAVHKAEHPPGRGYAPDVYQRGSSLVYGLPAFSTPGAATPTQAMLPPPTAVPGMVAQGTAAPWQGQAPVTAQGVAPPMPSAGGPGMIARGVAIPPGTIAQPPIMQASTGAAPVMPPQGDAAPAGGVQMAQAAPVQPPSPVPAAPTAGAPAGNTLRQVLQNLSPAERALLAHQKPDEVAKFLMARAAPNHETVLDTVDGTVKFVDKGDRLIGSRYQPVKGAELAIAMRNAAATERQAGAAEERNRIRGANEPLNADGTPNPNYAPQQGAVEAAKEQAKREAETRQLNDPNYAAGRSATVTAEKTAEVLPAVKKYQAELAMKDHEVSQNSASAARSSNANLDRLQALLEKVSTGKGTETIQNLKATAKAAGFDLESMGIADNVGVTQAAQALLAKMTLELGSSPDGGLKGSFSDKDVAFLKSGIPGLETTPEGRKLMVDFQKRVNQRAIDVARIKNDYVRSNKFGTDPAGMWAEVKKFADENPLFDPEKDAPKAPAAGGSLTMPPMNAIDAEIARRRKAGGQ